jgi:hypothetical protein
MAEKEATLVVRLKDFASKELRGLQSAISSLRSQFLLVAGAITGTIAVVWQMIKAYSENEQAVNRLNEALKSQGVTNQAVSQDLQKYAADLARVTTFTDEALMASEALFTTMGFGSDKIKKATQMAADLAARMRWDLQTSTMMVGKALNGNETILKRYGLTLADVEKMHGAAAAQLNTVAGKVQNLANRWEELQETLGKRLIPTVEFWIIAMGKAMTIMERWAGAEDKNLKGRELTIAALQKEKSALENNLAMYERHAAPGSAGAKFYADRIAKIETAINREKTLLALETTSKGAAPTFAGQPSKGDLEAAAKAKEQLDKDTAAAIQGSTTKYQALQALRQFYGATDAQLIAGQLSAEEAMQQASLLKRLQAAGQFDQQKKVMDAAKNKAEEANELKLTEFRKKQEEERKKNLAATLQFISTLSDSKSKELAAIGKAAAIAMATIYTLEAANRAMGATPWPPLNMAMAAMVYAAGMANVAKIMGVQMAEGGIVPARPGGTLATLGEGGQAEAVIPLGDRRAQAALGGGSVGNVYVTVNGVNDPQEIAARVGHEIIRAIRGQGQINFTRT